MKLSINTIYLATEGEGIRIGIPQVFVRVQGCKVCCSNCDSKETWKFDSQKEMELDLIIKKIEEFKVKSVSITGGDPLDEAHEDAVYELVKKLKSENYFVNIEVTGLNYSERIFDLVDFISADIKTPSTKIEPDLVLLKIIYDKYRSKVQIKAVVADMKDLNFLKNLNFDICITPCFSSEEEFPQKRFEEILKWNELNGGKFRVIAQQHKLIFGSKRKDV